ncbi:MAG: DNA gyrase subunit A [Clostridia bacterium]|nr:DNA gyrase subunit A [Clostridia bacterium]
MEHKDISYKDQKIVDVQMGAKVKQSFIEYAMSVIVSRALPDVRDGLKPVHRRILYSMYEDKLTYDRPTCKSATTVGNVLGRYHPHGDSSVYDAMVRLAQDFSMRYTLIDGQGNFGNVDGDGAAAYRYTEARLAKIANEMMTDIDKEVVNFVPNFDNRLREPEVLPSRFPNILVNGSIGIAVGMATNIPPHNLGEVIDATLYFMRNRDADVTDLMQYIKGPDFPTRAMICGSNGILQAYRTGKGRIIVRSRATIDEKEHHIIVTEIPYMVNKAQLVESIANCYKDKKVEGITGLRDESDGKKGIRIVIDYRRDANPQVILNQLYKYTQLQDTCAVNMIALVNGEPKLLGLREILSYYLEHQEDVIRRRTAFDLEKTKARLHILEGLKKALDIIDQIIETIKKSSSVSDARDQLMERFAFSEVQAQAIVDMTLGKLAGLERQKIEDEYGAKIAIKAELESILADESKVLDIIETELGEIKAKFNDARRTEITAPIDDIIDEDLIERHECVITMTDLGYIKRAPADTYTAQRRGGKGITAMGTKEEDFVKDVIIVNSHSYLLMFTSLGRVYMKKAYQIPEASRTAKGTNVVNLLELQPGERLTSIISVAGFENDEYFVMITKKGIIKRSSVKDYEYQRKSGKIAINLDEGDELAFVKHTKGDDDIIIASHNGRAARFNENDARVMGRTARGVKGITLKSGDYVVSAAVVDNEKKLITVTERGYGKRSEFDQFMAHKRGSTGIIAHKLSDKTGLLAGIATVGEEDDIMIITNDGTIIRTSVADVPVYGSNTSGVIVMRLDEGATIVNFASVKSEAEEDKEIAAEHEKAEAINAELATRAEEIGNFDDGDDAETEQIDNDEF